jgi:uncharacterized protein GlcG (DUF336 family)/catechol 2,3-dioxygenase-like lactoylglutathione lyase family enzyme
MDLLAFAKNIADRVEAQSARAKVPVAVSVIDIHGNILLQHRMSGAPVFSIEISERKAYTSALVGLRTADLSPLVQPGQDLFPLMGLSGGRFCSMGGGAPLTSEGQLVAGVGVSGGTVEQDVGILEAALREPATTCKVDMRLEVVVIHVADADRAKHFYGDLGWRLDIDYSAGDNYRAIQFTPPGSGCSIMFGKNVSTAVPGSVKAPYRFRHPGHPRGPASPWHRGQRAIPRHRRYISPCRRRKSGHRPQSATQELRVFRFVQRSGRERLGVPGDHRAIDRTHRGRRYKLHP